MASSKAKVKVNVRLEREVEGARTFWEITRAGLVLVTRSGRALSPGRTIEKTVPNANAADAAMAKAIEGKRREGYSEPVPRQKAGAQARKGVAARNLELEAMIAAAPHDPSPYLVYADWLQQAGDARGELIVAQHGIVASEDHRAIDAHERSETQLFETFGEELLGPLARYVMVTDSFRSYRSFSWRYGFIRRARLDRVRYLAAQPHDILEKLLTHPSGRFLEHVRLHNWPHDVGPDVAPVLAKHAPYTLVSMRLEVNDASVDWLWKSVPRLSHLWADSLSRSSIRSESLQMLRLTAAKVLDLDVLAAAHAPRLARLHLTMLPDESRPIDTVLHSSAALPSLAHLSVRRWIRTGARAASTLVPQDSLAIGVARSSAARSLRRLDLELPLGTRGVTALLADADQLAAIGELHIPRDGVASPADRALLERALPNLSWDETPEEEEEVFEALDPFPTASVSI